jgi:hypothetical protein
MISALVAWMLAAPAWAHDGHTDRAPWDACNDHALSEACAWQDAAHRSYDGTCRSVADALICVRQRPVEDLHEPEAWRTTAAIGVIAGFAAWTWWKRKRT